MFGLLKDRYWWPYIKKDIRSFCRYCKECQLAQSRREGQTLAPLTPSTEWTDVTLQPFDRWGLDLVGVMPKTNRENIWIIMAIDYTIRWPVAKALLDTIAETLAEFVYNLYLNYSVLKEIIIDQGANL